MNGRRLRLGQGPIDIGPTRPARSRALLWGAACCTVWMAIATSAALATTVVRKDFAALCAEADLIFVGTVSDVRSHWADADHNTIETLVTFAQLTSLLGVDGEALTLRFSGGSVDGIREEFVGAPRFAAGERVVVFARSGRWVSPLVGFNQGCFHVVDGSGGPVVSEPDAWRAAAGDEGNGGGGAAGAAESAQPLNEFLERVRRELAARPGGGR